MSDKALEEVLSGTFCDILKRAGISLSLTQLEAIREDSKRLAEHLEGITHNKTVRMLNKLQVSVAEMAGNFEDEIARVEARIDSYEYEMEDVFDEDDDDIGSDSLKPK